MRRSFLVLCLVLPGLLCAATGAAAAAQTQAVQSDAFPELEKLLKDQKLELALAAANKAVRDDPNSARAFFLLGRAQFYREQDDAARAAFDKAIELNPAFADAMFFRGLTFNYSAQPERGQADFERAIKINPKEAKYWFELGKLHERAGRNDAATAALQKTIELDPKKTSAVFSLGTLASARGEHAQAALLWGKVLDIDPDHVEAHWNLGVHHQLRGEAKMALSHFLAAYAKKPHDADVVKKLVQAYYRMEDFDNAAGYRLKLLDLIATSKDAEIRAMKEFCFDQFDVPEGRFFVYESLVKDRPLFYWFTFKLVSAENKVVKTINLESSNGLVEAGLLFILGQNQGSVHTNFGIAFEKMPAYPVLKKLVLEAHDGKLKVAATTTVRQQPKTGGD